MAEGTFPRSIKLGKRSIGWPSSAIDNWIDEQIQKSAALEGLNHV